MHIQNITGANLAFGLCKVVACKEANVGINFTVSFRRKNIT